MPDYQAIYNEQASQYELLVSREDYQGNIFRALEQIAPLSGLDVVEFGAGTGRLTCLLAPAARSIHAFDHSAHMLAVAKDKLTLSGLKNWHLAISDHRHMPLRDSVADLAISGWSICYMVVDHPDTWYAELDRALNEMRRLVKPGGRLILLETLGTGCEVPTPPSELLEYFATLDAQGFQREWIRTDYLFADLPEAQQSAKFFFGEEMLTNLQQEEQTVTLPECTGIWNLKMK